MHPFFAATYIPKKSRFGRIGVVELIPQIKELWETRRSELENRAAETISSSPPGMKIGPVSALLRCSRVRMNETR